MNRIFVIAITLLLSLSSLSSIFAQTKKEFDKAAKDLKINQMQVIGTHNSYARPVDPRVLSYVDQLARERYEKQLAALSPEQQKKMKDEHPNRMTVAEGLKYDHPPFPVQLDAGLRSLEIDVYYDPAGGRFADPAAYRFFREKGIKDLAEYDSTGLDKPGFKVLHVSDFDVRSHYPTFRAALAELKKWSDANPNHVPIFIQLEAKESATPIFPGSAEILKFDDKAFADLDREIVEGLGRNKLITPDDIRGKYKTLREAALAQNWPTLDNARGKIMFMLLARGLAKDGKTQAYAYGHPNLEKRAMFLYAKPEDDYAAVLLMDNAITRQEEIQKYVKMGYIARSRSDIETYEAKVNDKTRANAAFSSGAQVISTDFFRPGNGYGTDYYVQIPGGGVARINPVNGK